MSYFLPWAIIVGLFMYFARKHPLTRWVWARLSACFLMVVGFSVVSKAAAASLSNTSLIQSDNLLSVFFSSSFFSVLLLPVALGLIIAHRQGAEALLFAVSGISFFHQFLDIDYQFSFHSGDPSMVALFNILWRFLVFVVAPLWMVRAGSSRARLSVVVIPILLALTLEVIVNYIVHPHDSASLIGSFGMVLGRPILAIGVAYMFYCHGRVTRPSEADKAEIDPGMETANKPAI